MSKLVEHAVATAAFVSVSYKLMNSSTNSADILIFTILSISPLFALIVEKGWIQWNCQKSNNWLTQLKIVSRQPQTLGLWCIFLQLLLSAIIRPSISTNYYQRYFFLALLFIIHCPTLVIIISLWSLRKWKAHAFVPWILSIVIISVHLRSFFGFHWLSAIVLSLLPSFAGPFHTQRLMTLSAKSFTLGEFSLVYSSAVLALFGSMKMITSTGPPKDELDSILLVISWSLVACTTFGICCFIFPIFRRSAVVFWIGLLAVIVSSYALCVFLNGLDMVTWFLNFLLFDHEQEIAYRRWILFTFWLLCVAFTIRFVISCWSLPRLTTVHRKHFHFTIGLVVLSGLLYDAPLTLLCSALIFDGFVILEIARLFEIEPTGKGLHDVFQKFLDHQDQGPLVLTPIYLLIGCFLPIWIDVPINGIVRISLRHFGGFVAVGVGDAAAAIGGTYLGRTRWRLDPSGKKTVEGTLCGFLAQIIAILFISERLGSFSSLFTLEGFTWIIWSSFLLSMIETFSSQVDNLVLPLFAFLLLAGM